VEAQEPKVETVWGKRQLFQPEINITENCNHIWGKSTKDITKHYFNASKSTGRLLSSPPTMLFNDAIQCQLTDIFKYSATSKCSMLNTQVSAESITKSF